MSNKDKSVEERFDFIEGSEKKGGINPAPSTPRPIDPPKGQSPQRAAES